MSATKLRHFDQLIREAESLRGAGRRVVLCHGVFDLVHIGHIRYLQQARQLGDALIVTITPDCHVNKGPHRPIFTEDVRLDWLAALDCVDFTAINLWPTAVEAIANLRPDIFAKGGEYRDNKTPELLREEKAIADSGGQMVFIDDFTSSSSSLINNHLSPFSYEVNEYLQGIRQRHSSDEILDWLEKTSDLRLLVIGEAVLDEHYNCTVLGRSNNAPIVATRYESHVRRPAGALAIADYLSQFCEEVHLATMIGDSPSERGWIESRAAENVRCRFIEKRDCPTIVRRRYRESYFDAPLFEI
ncbi:MAG: adenylyltransferase/cytidyltransferase family protein, partial [Pirellulaceae bacterium]|nr:adenylyltransferase/cytidyltransferase family protein [Pirellulaceae bacterium]